MAGFRIDLTRPRIVDANGEPYPHSRISVYATGTTNLLTLYSEYTATVTRANPVVCTDGLVPVFYVDDDYTRVRVLIETSVNGSSWSTLSDDDNVAVNQFAGASSDDRYLGIFGGSAWTTTGSANAYLITTGLSLSSLTTLGVFAFKASFTNSGAATLNIDGLGAVALKKNGSEALESGDIVSGTVYVGAYDGTNIQLAGFVGQARDSDLTALASSGLAGFRGYISGLVPSNNGSDAVNDIDISAGCAMAADNSAIMVLAASLTKRLDASWAVGTGQGGLDGTESVAGTPDTSTWYHLYLIQRADTGVVDAIFSESASAPTLPSNYTRYRYIGSVYRSSGGQNDPFTAIETAGGGLSVLWSTTILSVDLSNTLTTSRRTDTIRVPLGFKVDALINTYLVDASSGQNAWIYSPDHSDVAPATNAAPLNNQTSSTSYSAGLQLRVRTNTSSQIAARSNISTVDTFRAAVLGWEQSRR